MSSYIVHRATLNIDRVILTIETFNVAGDSVVIQEPGDRLTLTMEDDIDWNERWKLCMSMKEITPVTTTPTEPAEMLLLVVNTLATIVV